MSGTAASALPGPTAGMAATLVVPNRMSALRPMSEWLVDAARRFGAPGKVVDALELAANEAVANVIDYAFQDGEAHDIVLTLSRAHDGLRLAIADDGAAFDPLSVPEPVQPASIDDATIGGLGIALVRGMTDECRYARVDDRNVLTLELRF